MGSALLPSAGAARAFRRARPGYRFRFPRDHAAHEEFRTEWWYYSGHLTAADGRPFGFQLTFFRSGLEAGAERRSRWAARNLYLAHLAITDERRGRFRYAERMHRGALGEAGASEEAFRVWIGAWEASGSGRAHRLRARDGGLAVDLALAPVKPPVVHGRDGVSRKGEAEGQASHYYSLTRMRAAGTLAVEGTPFAVTGQAWMDHEFGSDQLGPTQVGWDWFALQLEDQTDAMLYLIRHEDGRPDPASSGTWVDRDGRAAHLALADFRVEVLDRWRSPRSGGVYPMGWRLQLPGRSLDLRVTPTLADQELVTDKSTQVTYWEGSARVEGASGGRPIAGRAYVEMTGYAGRFRKRI
jgi:predicted secreted hydrolase